MTPRPIPLSKIEPDGLSKIESFGGGFVMEFGFLIRGLFAVGKMSY